MNCKSLAFSLSLAFFSLSLIAPSFQAAEARIMCCPVKDKCAPKADKCSPQAQCQPKDKCGSCPDGLVETRKWWPW